MRVADSALLLRRTLVASYEDWSNGPRTLDEHVTWAHKLARGFQVTGPAMDALVALRPDASRRVQRAVGRARDEFYKAADIVNRTVRTTFETLNQTAQERADEPSLRKASAHIRRCITELTSVTPSTG